MTTKCQSYQLIPGPHPGCAEFAPPDVVPCAHDASWRLTIYSNETVHGLGLCFRLVTVEVMFLCTAEVFGYCASAQEDSDVVLTIMSPIDDAPIDGPGVYVQPDAPLRGML